MSSERREAARVTVRLEVAYEDRDRQVFLRTRDLSEVGIFLHSPELPAVGDDATVTLDLPGQEALVRLSGRVARTESGPSAAEPAGFALEFRESGRPSVSRLAIQRFVQSAPSS
ncbi:MAG: PilZ domain-containing protein [Proteobacteria bacterium]|nr:PilZ domain-containing protein [Pseudomonadota bacterium]